MCCFICLFFTARKQSLQRLCFYRCLSFCPQGGVHGCSREGAGHASMLGGHALLLWGGMCGCSGGACMVAPRGCAWLFLGGHVWLLWGGVHGCSGGACMVALEGHVWLLQGGMRGCSGRVCVVAPGGACVVAPSGCAWLLPGGHAWLLWGGMHGFIDEIRSMSGRYTSYWNAFLFFVFFWKKGCRVGVKLQVEQHTYGQLRTNLPLYFPSMFNLGLECSPHPSSILKSVCRCN